MIKVSPVFRNRLGGILFFINPFIYLLLIFEFSLVCFGYYFKNISATFFWRSTVIIYGRNNKIAVSKQRQ